MAGCWHGQSGLAPLAAAWQAAAAAGNGTVFQEFAFARHWAQVFSREVELRVWVQAAPPLVVPLALRHHRLEMAGEGLFDYLDLIGPPADGAQPAAEAVARWAWSEACFTGVPATSPHTGFWNALGALPQPFAAAPCRAAGTPLHGEHQRLAARWHKARVVLRLATGPGDRRHLLAWLLDHKARALAGSDQRSVLGNLEQRWLAAMVQHEPQLSELWALERAGETLAALLCWRNRAVRYGYTLSYDQHAAELSPGILLLFAVLNQTMNEGCSFNLLTGEQPYKLRFATHRDPLLRYGCRRG